jgi:nucleotide-binding universal stress UspA family protein
MPAATGGAGPVLRWDSTLGNTMKILLAADGSPFTMKALAFLVSHEGLAGKDGELVVLNVQPPVPPGVTGMVGSNVVADYHRDEAQKVLAPIKEFLDRHPIRYRSLTVVGQPVEEILRTAQAEHAQLIAMGTHGYGVVARLVMGSVAQRVVAQSELPVLLVK